MKCCEYNGGALSFIAGLGIIASCISAGLLWGDR